MADGKTNSKNGENIDKDESTDSNSTANGSSREEMAMPEEHDNERVRGVELMLQPEEQGYGEERVTGVEPMLQPEEQGYGEERVGGVEAMLQPEEQGYGEERVRGVEPMLQPEDHRKNEVADIMLPVEHSEDNETGEDMLENHEEGEVTQTLLPENNGRDNEDHYDTPNTTVDTVDQENRSFSVKGDELFSHTTFVENSLAVPSGRIKSHISDKDVDANFNEEEETLQHMMQLRTEQENAMKRHYDPEEQLFAMYCYSRRCAIQMYSIGAPLVFIGVILLLTFGVKYVAPYSQLQGMVEVRCTVVNSRYTGEWNSCRCTSDGCRSEHYYFTCILMNCIQCYYQHFFFNSIML